MPFLTVDMNSSWLFHDDQKEEMLLPDYDDSGWRELDLPHDWSIEREFSPDAPGHCRAAYLPTGKGCYRKRLKLPPEWRGLRLVLAFDGVYRNAQVFINGRKAGGRPWGYIPFEVDITGYVDWDTENLIAVAVDNSEMPGARWYTGSGIYRDVRLKAFDELRFPAGGIAITAHDVSSERAVVHVGYEIENTSKRRVRCETIHSILDAAGLERASSRKTHSIGAGLTIQLEDSLEVVHPALWSPAHPSLYTMESKILVGEKAVEFERAPFGIREISCSPEKGLLVNGERVKVKGVCLHNDGGPLGAACGKQTFQRQLSILKESGCNAVRTAHHPFSPLFLDACDETGMLVLAEAFDEWQEPGRAMPYSDGEPQFIHINYYAGLFDTWAKQDLTDMVRRDRNHPSIFMWSVGNEIPQMNQRSGTAIAERLVEWTRNLDARPVTCAALCSDSEASMRNMEVLDVAGFNYPSADHLDKFHASHPGVPILVTEHHSAQPRRPLGQYFARGARQPSQDYAYENSFRFVMEHEEMTPGADAWFAAASRDFVMGEFIWTGFDYLGEPTPYDFPAHTSFFGVVDTCGNPKDGYYFYRSAWRDEPLVHMASHWDYREGDTVDLLAISNCDAVELLLNGKSMGRLAGKRHLFHFELPFEPGVLEAHGMRDGVVCTRESLQTSGTPIALRLSRSFSGALSAGMIEYVTCELIDSQGVRARNLSYRIRFDVLGGGRLLAVANGSQMNLEPFQNSPCVSLCDGRCLAIVKADGKEGMEVIASLEGSSIAATLGIETIG